MDYKICRDAVTQYQQVKTEEIPLDYSYGLEMIDGDELMVPLRNANYNPYTLACFRSKMNVYLGSYNQYCSMIPKRYHGRMHMFLQIYDKDGFIPITNEIKKRLSPVVRQCITVNPEHIVVFNAGRNMSDDSIPSSWMKTIVPHLNPPDHIPTTTGAIHKLELIYQDSIVYAKLSRGFEYSEGVKLLEAWFRQTLTYLYVKGCTILDADRDRNFIDDWRFTPWTDDRLTVHHSLYKLSWNNTLVAPTPTVFIYSLLADQAMNQGCAISIGSEIITPRTYNELLTALENYFRSGRKKEG